MWPFSRLLSKKESNNKPCCRPLKSFDRLQVMVDQQREFIDLLKQKRNFPEYPIDITSKEGQKFLKGIMQDCMGELWESQVLLKNSKSHRAAELKDVDKDAYIEELCDVLHFFFEIVIYSGIDLDRLFIMYMEKGQINQKRIEEGY